MGVMTTGSFGKLLWPGLNAIYGKAYSEHPEEWSKLFDKNTSRKRFEEDLGISGFGLANVTGEGEPVNFDSEMQAFITRYNHVTYSLGFIITKEMMEDDQYDVVGERRAKGLAFSMRQTKENVAANVYNRAFNSSYTGGDGVEMISTAHPNAAGGTWSNELATPADLSEAALEQACIDIMKWTNDRGLKISVMPETLILPPDLVFEAERILKSTGQTGISPGATSGGGHHELNALNSMGKFRDVVANHYLTDEDAWFIRTNAPDGLKYFERRADSFDMDNDFDTDNAKFKATARYSFGWTDPRGIYGSPGA